MFLTLVNVVQHGFVPVNLQEVLKLSVQDDGNIHPGICSKMKYQTQLSTLLGVQNRTVQASIGSVIKYEQGTIFFRDPNRLF